MKVADAFESAHEILIEERLHQTVSYSASASHFKKQFDKSVGQSRRLGANDLVNLPEIFAERKMRPRPVHEFPKEYEFSSVNYKLLLTIYSQLQENDRPEFIAKLLLNLPMRYSTRGNGTTVIFPVFGWYCSELPLLAEFCVRTGHTAALLKALNKPPMPTPGLAIMMAYMEEMVALNFNLFSDKELKEMPVALAHLREIAERQTYSARGPTTVEMVPNPHFKRGFEQEGEEIYKAIDGIIEECRKARYFYLKGVLQQTPNLEVENDKAKVVEFLASLGFNPLLMASLQKAEELYGASSNAFDLKSCLGHIRSFYEHLNIDAGQTIAKNLGITVVDEWDPTVTFLKNKAFLSSQLEKFARGIYALLSDEGVHPLIAEREFARLLRNVVIEYGLMFLTLLQKKGIAIPAHESPKSQGSAARI